jgi:hypothetical protein
MEKLRLTRDCNRGVLAWDNSFFHRLWRTAMATQEN